MQAGEFERRLSAALPSPIIRLDSSEQEVASASKTAVSVPQQVQLLITGVVHDGLTCKRSHLLQCAAWPGGPVSVHSCV